MLAKVERFCPCGAALPITASPGANALRKYCSEQCKHTAENESKRTRRGARRCLSCRKLLTGPPQARRCIDPGACADRYRAERQLAWHQGNKKSRAKARTCLTCEAVLPADAPRQQRRCPGVGKCAENHKYPPDSPRRHRQRKSIKKWLGMKLLFGLYKGDANREHQAHSHDLDPAAGYMGGVQFTHTSTMYVFALGRYWKIGGRPLEPTS